MKLSQQVVSIGLITLSLCGSSVGEGVKFQLNFVPGKVYVTKTSMAQTSSMVMAGQEIKTVMKMDAVTNQKVTAGEEGGVSVEQAVSSMKMDLNAGGMAMVFDSENPEGPLAAMFEPLLEAKTTMVLGKDGEVLKVDAPVVPGMENLGMGREELAQSAREMADMMPNKEIAVGESWTSKSLLPTGGMTEKPVTITYTMTFEGMVENEGKELAKVSVKGSIEDGDENIQVTSREISGVMLYDPKGGQPHETTLLLDIEIGLPEGAAVAEGAAGKMPMKMKTVSRLVEVK